MPVFTCPDTAQINSQAFLQREFGLRLYGYVILENHMHCIADAEDLPLEIHSFNSYAAKMLVRYFEAHNNATLILQNQEILFQKLEYIHNNPVKRGYCGRANPLAFFRCAQLCGPAGLD